jgi:hypothetical protein
MELSSGKGDFSSLTGYNGIIEKIKTPQTKLSLEEGLRGDTNEL